MSRRTMSETRRRPKHSQPYCRVWRVVCIHICIPFTLRHVLRVRNWTAPNPFHLLWMQEKNRDWDYCFWHGVYFFRGTFAHVTGKRKSTSNYELGIPWTNFWLHLLNRRFGEVPSGVTRNAQSHPRYLNSWKLMVASQKLKDGLPWRRALKRKSSPSSIRFSTKRQRLLLQERKPKRWRPKEVLKTRKTVRQRNPRRPPTLPRSRRRKKTLMHRKSLWVHTCSSHSTSARILLMKILTVSDIFFGFVLFYILPVVCLWIVNVHFCLHVFVLQPQSHLYGVCRTKLTNTSFS